MFLLSLAVVTLAAFVSAASYSSAISEPAANRLTGERKGTSAPPKPASPFADWDALVDADSAPLVPCGCSAFLRADGGAAALVTEKPNGLNSGKFTKSIWSE